MSTAPALLRRMLEAAIEAARPAVRLPGLLPDPARGTTAVLACGKAGAPMAEAAEAHYLARPDVDPQRLCGLCVTRHGYGRPLRRIACIEAGHPVPDAAGLAATERVLAMAQGLSSDDVAVILLSGGGSANWVAPAGRITLEEKQGLTRALLASGATIGEINTVRKHLSRIKGGRLAAAAFPARIVTLAISDVPGDDPSLIASGPSVPDSTRAEDASALLEAYGIPVPESVREVLASVEGETPGPDHPAFSNASFDYVARPREALEAAAEVARAAGIEVIALGDDLEGEARLVAAEHAAMARQVAREGRRAVILSGGELTVTIKGDGRGGPNQEYALALALSLQGNPSIHALAADTDGTDGGSGGDDPAGAIVMPDTPERAAARGLDLAAMLNDNDSSGAFNALGDLIMTGATGTNVNDFRAIAINLP